MEYHVTSTLIRLVHFGASINLKNIFEPFLNLKYILSFSTMSVCIDLTIELQSSNLCTGIGPSRLAQESIVRSTILTLSGLLNMHGNNILLKSSSKLERQKLEIFFNQF